jgi:hypothetical protein
MYISNDSNAISLFINFLFISINENNWLAESMFFVSVHWIEFVSHVKFRQLQPRFGWLATEFYDYTLSISLAMLNLKLCQQLKY